MTQSTNQEKMTSEKNILEKLLVSEEDIVKNLSDLVDKAKDVFVIEKLTGKVIFKNFGDLTDPQRILALLVGRYFATRLNLLNDSSMRVSEIANALGRPKTSLSGPLKHLVTKTYVEKLSNRKYNISYNRIRDVFENYFGDKNESGRDKEKN